MKQKLCIELSVSHYSPSYNIAAFLITEMRNETLHCAHQKSIPHLIKHIDEQAQIMGWVTVGSVRLGSVHKPLIISNNPLHRHHRAGLSSSLTSWDTLCLSRPKTNTRAAPSFKDASFMKIMRLHMIRANRREVMEALNS